MKFRSGEEVLRVENLSFQNPENKKDYLVHDVSFTLNKGEVLGIAGLMGAGRTEVLEAIFGLFPKYVSGKISIEGKEVQIKSVKRCHCRRNWIGARRPEITGINSENECGEKQHAGQP